MNPESGTKNGIKMELTQTNGFGVGVFWRNVVQEWWVITTTYRPNGQVDGRGGEKLTQPPYRTQKK